MPKIELPKGFIELSKLEKQYPNWKETPDNVKEKILKLALANGGFGLLNHEKEEGKNYLDYLYSLARKASSDIDYEENIKKLRSFAKAILDGYSPGLIGKRSTEKKLAKYYVLVEEYRAKHTESSILEATKRVAKDLGVKETYVHRKYYEMHKKLKWISLEEVKEIFKL